MYGHTPQSAHQEVTFFVGGGVQVTSSRFVVGGQMYPVAAITSVAPFSIPAQRAGLILLAALLGLFTLGSALAARWGAVFLFGTLAGLCGWRASARVPMHGVIITTSGMQIRPLTSANLVFVQQVVAALHQAVASR